MQRLPPLRRCPSVLAIAPLLVACGTSPEGGDRTSDTSDASDVGATDIVDIDADSPDVSDVTAPDAPDTDSCSGSTPLCAYGCGGDAFEAASCVLGAWVCPIGTTPIDDCPPGSCFGMPLPGEVCDDGWQCRPATPVLPACGAPPEMLCADCRGFDASVHSREDCACTCADGMVRCGDPPPSCETWSESDLPGVRIALEPLDDCVFTLAEAAEGIAFAYGIVAETGYERTTSTPLDAGGCGRPGVPGLTAFAEIGDGEQRWCLCDVGLCPNPGDENVPIEVGSARHEVLWNGTNWTGPSDFGNPEGPAFPPGEYTIEVRAQGTWDAGVGRAPDAYSVRGGMRFVLVE